MNSFKLCIALVSILLANACQNNQSTEGSTTTTEQAAIEQDRTVSEPDSQLPAAPSFDRLDNLDWSGMTKVASSSGGGGDCSSVVTHYQSDAVTVVIDSTNCYDYGKTNTFYLVNDKEEVQMVHEKSLTPFYNSADEGFYYEVSEKIIDFSDSLAVGKSRIDTLPRSTPEAADPFAQITKAFSQEGVVADERSQAFWQRRYGYLKEEPSEE